MKSLKESFIGIIVLVLIFAGVSFFMRCPESYIGYGALKEIRSDLLLKMIPHSLWTLLCTGLLIFYLVAVFREIREILSRIIAKKMEYREYKKCFNDFGYYGIMDKPKGSVILECIKYVIATVTILAIYIAFGITFVPYTKEYLDMNIFAKTKLLFDVSSDIKTEETVTEEYNNYIPMQSEERGTAYFYIICSNDNTSKHFSIGSKDYEKLAEYGGMYQKSLTVEYFKKSGFIKNYDIRGKKYDWAIKTQEDMDMSYDKVEIRLEDNIVYRPEHMESYGEIGWVIKRNGEPVTPIIRDNTPYTIYATYYDHTDISQYIQEKGDYEVYLSKVAIPNNKKVAFSISNSIEFTVE